MIKRVVDIGLSLTGLMLAAPLLGTAMLLIWLHDFHSPIYMARRVGRNGASFRMVKLRTMIPNADRNGVDSTSMVDPRLTPVGRIVRKCKLDEIPQFINVLIGDMSMVGPRPNVETETRYYTAHEQLLLSIRPGVTDISSIVFSDLNDILKNENSANLDYSRYVRPWKSRLGLLYVERATLGLDFWLILLTASSAISKPLALRLLEKTVRQLGAGELLCSIVARRGDLPAAPPPGRDTIVTEEEIRR